MGVSTKARISGLLGNNKRHPLYIRVFALLAVVVALGVTLVLMQNGVAMTHTEVVLDCHVAGDVAHTHNVDCYNSDGELVCPLPERPSHTHTDACYNEEGELACGLDELTSEHVHGPGCFVTVTVPDKDVSGESDTVSAGAVDAAKGDESQAATDVDAAANDGEAAQDGAEQELVSQDVSAGTADAPMWGDSVGNEAV